MSYASITHDAMEKAENERKEILVFAYVEITNSGNIQKTGFESVFEAVEYFERYQPKFPVEKITLFIKRENKFDIYGEKTYTLFQRQK